MELLDRVFQVIFARCRRKVGDTNLQLAWSRANNKLGGYLIFPVVAASLLLIVVLSFLIHPRTAAEPKQWGSILAVIVWIVATIFLSRRFRKYLSAPPTLLSDESPGETRILFWFRVGIIGICLLGFLIVYLLRNLVDFPNGPI